jgi:hypothetical protein
MAFLNLENNIENLLEFIAYNHNFLIVNSNNVLFLLLSQISMLHLIRELLCYATNEKIN